MLHCVRRPLTIRKPCFRKIPGAADGSITVFLSLTLTCICALMGGLFESARTAGTGWHVQMALDSSLDSLMSKYHRDVWEQYRIFALEFEDAEGLAAEMEPYLEGYFNSAPFYPVGDRKQSVSKITGITEEEGRWFEKEILDYMRLGVWNMEKEPGALKEMADGIKEAESLGAVAEEYQENGRHLLELERIVEEIGENLKRQREYLEKGNEQLKDGNGSGFIRTAGTLERELDKIPALVRKYEAKAEELKTVVKKTEQGAEERRNDLKPQTWRLVTEEMDSYRSYTDSEGSRRKEVKQTEATAGENKEIIKAAVERAEEIQEYIDSWEPDDDDDELDEERLWRKVLTVTGRFRVDTRFEKTGIKDRKRLNVLESLSRLAGTDLLSIVVPEGKVVSGDRVDTSQFPSVTELRGGQDGVEEETGRSLLDMALIHEYAAVFFTSFLSEQERPVKYEQEYILSGKDTDRGNLKAAVNRIAAVREAMNLLYLLGNSEKRAEAEQLAIAITGASGLAPLVAVTTFFILTVWALAESIEDVSILLRGGKVPFVKQRDDWKVSLSGLAGEGVAVLGKAEDSGKEGRGFDYQAYLKLLLLLAGRTQKEYRMMDMIQKNIRIIQTDFLMRKCACRLEAEVKGRGVLIPVRKRTVKAY